MKIAGAISVRTYLNALEKLQYLSLLILDKALAMVNIKSIARLLLLVVIFASGSAYADRPRGHAGHSTHSRVGIGLYFGLPYAYPYYPFPYYPYSYYPPPVVVAPSQAPVYIEQSPSTTEQGSVEGYYWNYCEKSENYYPYVKECPDGWQKISPTPQQ